MNPISVSAVANKNGVLTIFVLMDDGSILKKSENDSRWHEIDKVENTIYLYDEPKTNAISGYRNEPEPKPNMAGGNKGRKKRGN